MDFNQEIKDIIIQLEKNFDINNINSYQNILLIIYNSLFIYEDELTSDLKYAINNLLFNIINQINEYNQTTMHNLEDFYTYLVPYYMQNNQFQLR